MNDQCVNGECQAWNVVDRNCRVPPSFTALAMSHSATSMNTVVSDHGIYRVQNSDIEIRSRSAEIIEFGKRDFRKEAMAALGDYH